MPSRYERYLIAFNNGLYDYAGPPELSRTVKMEVYFPPLVLPTPVEMPGWTAEMFPCESAGSLSCDGWTVVRYTAHTWENAFNNTYYYNFPIGIRLSNDCSCNTPLVCEVVGTESVPGVDATGEPQYLVWLPSIQYTSTTSAEPDYAVFWTHNWDVWKGERDGVRADMLLNFTDHPLYIYKNGDEPTGNYLYSSGRRAVKAQITDWSNCNYMEFLNERIAVPEPEVTSTGSDTGAVQAMAADTPPSPPAESNNTMAIAALAIAVLSMVVALGAIFYAHQKVSSLSSGAAAPPVMNGHSAPVKSVV